MMLTVNEAKAAEMEYLRVWGRPNEADFSLNDISRTLIQAMAAEHGGQAFLGAFRGTEGLVPYQGQKITNFQFDFCVPTKDPVLGELLQCRAQERPPLTQSCLFDMIYERVAVLGGHWLLWV